MQVQVHNVVAECPPMQCVRCGTRTSHLQLLVQIGDKAIERSTETLERIKAQRAKLPSKSESEPP